MITKEKGAYLISLPKTDYQCYLLVDIESEDDIAHWAGMPVTEFLSDLEDELEDFQQTYLLDEEKRVHIIVMFTNRFIVQFPLLFLAALTEYEAINISESDERKVVHIMATERYH